MTRNTTIAWISGLLFVAVGVAGGCGWSNSRARGLHLWKEDHVTYRFRNFPFVPSNAVGQCPAPGDCPTEFIEPPFFGYHDTCWRRWPQGWEPCPVEPVAEVEEVEPESSSTESATPSPSDRPEDSNSDAPTPAKEPDSVIVPATPKETPKIKAAPSQPPKKETPARKPKASNVDAPKTETPKPSATSSKPSSQDTPPKPAAPKKSEAPVVQPPTPRAEKRSSNAAPERQPAKPPSQDDASTVPQTPSFFPSAFRAQTSPAEVAVAKRGKRAARSVPSLPATAIVPVPHQRNTRETAVAPPVVVSSSVRHSQRLRRSLRDRMRLSAGTGEPPVKRTSAVRTDSSTRPITATHVSAPVKARPILRNKTKKLASDSRDHHSDDARDKEPKLMSQSVPATPISTVGSSQGTAGDNASSFSSRSDAPEPVIIDARKLRAAQK